MKLKAQRFCRKTGRYSSKALSQDFDGYRYFKRLDQASIHKVGGSNYLAVKQKKGCVGASGNKGCGLVGRLPILEDGDTATLEYTCVVLRRCISLFCHARQSSEHQVQSYHESVTMHGAHACHDAWTSTPLVLCALDGLLSRMCEPLAPQGCIQTHAPRVTTRLAHPCHNDLAVLPVH